MTNKKDRRQVDGILLLDKPSGMSSNKALQIVKRLFNAKKAGHTGSLDPLATGMLPLCFGEATKFAQYWLDADKAYQVTAKLGQRTTTSDAEGEIISERPVPKLSKRKLKKHLSAFLGETTQTPSMYSALKYEGKPLYYYARKGIDVPRKQRQITVYDIELLSQEAEQITFTVHCSKGTYVRTIVDDLGEILGCGAHVSQLRRLSVSGFDADGMITLDDIEANPDAALEKLLPVNIGLPDWPCLTLNAQLENYVLNGQAVLVPGAPVAGTVQLFNQQDNFLGLGEVMDDGMIKPKRLVVT